MAAKHPYTSSSGGIVQAVAHLRNSFPANANIDAGTLKKLGIASNNESYLINILKFIGVIDTEGRKTEKASAVFSKHGDDEFQPGFAEMVETAYSDLFSLYGSNAWSLPTDKLVSFFRSSDQTSSIVGQRQATTFQTLAAVGGKAELAPPRAPASPGSRKQSKPKVPGKEAKNISNPTVSIPPIGQEIGDIGTGNKRNGNGVGLTVRIEVNLPSGADQGTYDNIFKSIRENLING